MPAREVKGENDKTASAEKRPAATDKPFNLPVGLGSAADSPTRPANLHASHLSPGDVLQLQRTIGNRAVTKLIPRQGPDSPIMRRIEQGKLNVVGETHKDSEPRRPAEKEMLTARYGFSPAQYWAEDDFKVGEQFGDSPRLLYAQSAAFLHKNLASTEASLTNLLKQLADPKVGQDTVLGYADLIRYYLQDIRDEDEQLRLAARRVADLAGPGEEAEEANLAAESSNIMQGYVEFHLEQLAVYPAPQVAAPSTAAPAPAAAATPGTAPPGPDFRSELLQDLTKLFADLKNWQKEVGQLLTSLGYQPAESPEALRTKIREDRSEHMRTSAEAAAGQSIVGVWKVGDNHISDMQKGKPAAGNVTLTPKAEFDQEYEAWAKSAKPAEAKKT